MGVCVCAGVCVHECMRMCVCVCVHMCVCVCVSTCVCACMLAYVMPNLGLTAYIFSVFTVNFEKH